jgi:ABC-type lipoprotein export system ATPase subunit
MDILRKLNQDGTTMMIITHDEDIAKRCTRVVELKK